jgi:DNA-binding transcriptional LysR family regulator
VEQGRLVRPVQDALEFHDRHHYVITHKNAKLRPEYVQFREWLGEEVATMMREWRSVETEAAK